MENTFCRPALPGDLDDIIQNWCLCFGDPERFPRRLLQDCALMKNVLVVEHKGRVAANVLLFHGLQLRGIPCSYLYALCTHPEFEGRGFASALLGRSAELSRSRGSRFLLLRPGDEGLEKWYAGKNYRTISRSCDVSLDISGPAACGLSIIDACEYTLPDGGSLFTPELIAAQDALQYCFGGAFMRVGETLLCGEYDGLILRLRHCSASAADLPRTAAAAAAYFGAKAVTLRAPSSSGDDPALMALPLSDEPEPLPEGLFFPFTLD